MTSEHVSFDKLQDGAFRDEVVASYKAQGLGGERYGVVCPNKECHKRICLQGITRALEHPDKYCLCPGNYQDFGYNEDNIFTVLQEHGIDPNRGSSLNPVSNMNEATVKRKKRGKAKKKAGENGTNAEQSSGSSSSDGSGDGSNAPTTFIPDYPSWQQVLAEKSRIRRGLQ